MVQLIKKIAVFTALSFLFIKVLFADPYQARAVKDVIAMNHSELLLGVNEKGVLFVEQVGGARTTLPLSYADFRALYITDNGTIIADPKADTDERCVVKMFNTADLKLAAWHPSIAPLDDCSGLYVYFNAQGAIAVSDVYTGRAAVLNPSGDEVVVNVDESVLGEYSYVRWMQLDSTNKLVGIRTVSGRDDLTTFVTHDSSGRVSVLANVPAPVAASTVAQYKGWPPPTETNLQYFARRSSLFITDPRSASPLVKTKRIRRSVGQPRLVQENVVTSPDGLQIVTIGRDPTHVIASEGNTVSIITPKFHTHELRCVQKAEVRGTDLSLETLLRNNFGLQENIVVTNNGTIFIPSSYREPHDPLAPSLLFLPTGEELKDRYCIKINLAIEGSCAKFFEKENYYYRGLSQIFGATTHPEICQLKVNTRSFKGSPVSGVKLQVVAGDGSIQERFTTDKTGQARLKVRFSSTLGNSWSVRLDPNAKVVAPARTIALSVW